MARPVSRWNRVGKWFSAVVVLCFFLPFFGISCDGVDVVHFSGTDMVGGCRPGGMMVDAADQAQEPGAMKGGKMDAKIDNVDKEPLAIVAFAAAIAAAVAAFALRTKGGRAIALVSTIVCLGSLIGLFITEKGKLEDAIAMQNPDKNKKHEPGEELGREMSKSMMKDTKIEAGGRFGLYITVLMLLISGYMVGTALKQGEDPPPDAPPGPFPPVPMA